MLPSHDNFYTVYNLGYLPRKFIIEEINPKTLYLPGLHLDYSKFEDSNTKREVINFEKNCTTNTISSKGKKN